MFEVLPPNQVNAAADMLKEQYPNQRIEVIDSLCSSAGYGFLVDETVKMLESGKTIDETISMIMETRQTIHHQFFSTNLSYYRRSGRMSGAAAIGNVLNIVPIMHLNDQGKIIAYDKVRGVKKAIKEHHHHLLYRKLKDKVYHSGQSATKMKPEESCSCRYDHCRFIIYVEDL